MDHEVLEDRRRLHERASVIFLDFDRLYMSRILLSCTMSIDVRYLSSRWRIRICNLHIVTGLSSFTQKISSRPSHNLPMLMMQRSQRPLLLYKSKSTEVVVSWSHRWLVRR
jgi:hypothetical protein